MYTFILYSLPSALLLINTRPLFISFIDFFILFQQIYVWYKEDSLSLLISYLWSAHCCAVSVRQFPLSLLVPCTWQQICNKQNTIPKNTYRYYKTTQHILFNFSMKSSLVHTILRLCVCVFFFKKFLSLWNIYISKYIPLIFPQLTLIFTHKQKQKKKSPEFD